MLLVEERHMHELQAIERIRNDLQAELATTHEFLEAERNKVNTAKEDIAGLDNEKRLLLESVAERGREIRDLQEERERI